MHLVHSLLNLSKQIMYVFEEHDECYTVDRIFMNFLIPVFSFLQLYTVYKYSNVRSQSV